jgi:hypothetical protein
MSIISITLFSFCWMWVGYWSFVCRLDRRRNLFLLWIGCPVSCCLILFRSRICLCDLSIILSTEKHWPCHRRSCLLPLWEHHLYSMSCNFDLNSDGLFFISSWYSSDGSPGFLNHDLILWQVQSVCQVFFQFVC